MRRKFIALAAGLVVLISAAILLAWVNQADRRAIAAQDPVTVLIAATDIPAGTSADAAAAMVATKQVPASALVPGAITTLDAVAGKVVLSTIHVGEQIIAMRWGTTSEVAGTSKIPIPTGYQSVSFQLSPDRLNGGKIAAGDRIGIFITDTVAVSATPGAGEQEKKATKLVLPKVLVLDVVGGVTGGVPESGGSANPVPTQMIMVTVALTSVQAEKLIWGLEGAKVYISLQNDQTDTDVPVSPITGDDVLNR